MPRTIYQGAAISTESSVMYHLPIDFRSNLCQHAPHYWTPFCIGHFVHGASQLDLPPFEPGSPIVDATILLIAGVLNTRDTADILREVAALYNNTKYMREVLAYMRTWLRQRLDKCDGTCCLCYRIDSRVKVA